MNLSLKEFLTYLWRKCSFLLFASSTIRGPRIMECMVNMIPISISWTFLEIFVRLQVRAAFNSIGEATPTPPPPKKKFF